MTQELSKSVFRLCFFLLLYKLFNLLYIEDPDENIAKNALDIFYDFLIQCGQHKIFIYFLFLFYKNLIHFRYFLLDKLAKICCAPLKYLNLRRNYI